LLRGKEQGARRREKGERSTGKGKSQKFTCLREVVGKTPGLPALREAVGKTAGQRLKAESQKVKVSCLSTAVI